jgi:predicted ATP-dependent protease
LPWDNGRVNEDEVLRRMDQALERSSRVIELNGRAFQQLVRSHNELVESNRRMERSVDDLHDLIRANIDATFKLIDRLGPSPGTAT